MITLGVGDCSITKGQHRKARIWDPFRITTLQGEASLELRHSCWRKGGSTLTTGLLVTWRLFANNRIVSGWPTNRQLAGIQNIVYLTGPRTKLLSKAIFVVHVYPVYMDSVSTSCKIANAARLLLDKEGTEAHPGRHGERLPPQ
jgi:hypothetical protein